MVNSNFRQFSMIGFVSIFGWLYCGNVALESQAFAGSLYWDPGIPGYPKEPLSPRPLSKRSGKVIEQRLPPIVKTLESPVSTEAETVMDESVLNPGSVAAVGSNEPTSTILEKAPSVDTSGIAIDNHAIQTPANDTEDQAPEEHGDVSSKSEAIRSVIYDRTAFRSDPTYKDEPYDPEAQILIYGGKTEVAPQRPIPEIGRAFYDVGPLSQGVNLLGKKNLIFAHFYGFGDWRTAVAMNNNGDKETAQIATRLNLDLDLGLTATERFHALLQPLQKDAAFTRCEFAGDDSIDDCELEFDIEPQTLFFEGDLAAITAGITNDYPAQDLPVTGGLIPLLFQNGIWVEDAFWGGAISIPALNSRKLDISNADVTAFAGFDEVNANGVIDASGKVAESNVNIYGIGAFIEALEGYIEAGYGYVDAEDNLSDQDYHSATVALTRRYGGKISNSLRLVGSFGQDRDQGENQNGLMVLIENSLITSKPYQLVPYANFFAGFDRPVPLARQNGILKNTGITFESDALTGFPFLDDTGQNAYGGALGVEYLFDLDQQVVVEIAGVRNLEDISSSRFEEVVGNQYAIGMRYQLPLSNAWLLRADAIYGVREGEADLTGARTELRFKF